jgi:hypothetical protein
MLGIAGNGRFQALALRLKQHGAVKNARFRQ